MKRALPYVGITAAFLLVALIGNWLVAWGTTSVSPAAPAQPRAWFVNPRTVDKGVDPGTPLHVMIRFGDDKSLSWVSVNDGRVLARGTLIQTRSGRARLEIPTSGAAHGTWLYLQMDSIRTPLSVRIL